MIPKQLQKDKIRFYLAGHPNNEKWAKRAIEKKWTTSGCYKWDNPILKAHIKKGYNYGVVGGLGQLVILDFDDKEFYEKVKNKLPLTFATFSATKRLPHLYYWFRTKMFKKRAMKRMGKTVCDVQALGSGVIGPNSAVGRNFYDVMNDVPIAVITKKILYSIFGMNKSTKLSVPTYNIERTENPEAVVDTIRKMDALGLNRTSNCYYECPLHSSKSKMNLKVLPDGTLYCHNESKYWPTVDDFKRTWDLKKRYSLRIS